MYFSNILCIALALLTWSGEAVGFNDNLAIPASSSSDVAGGIRMEGVAGGGDFSDSSDGAMGSVISISSDSSFSNQVAPPISSGGSEAMSSWGDLSSGGLNLLPEVGSSSSLSLPPSSSSSSSAGSISSSSGDTGPPARGEDSVRVVNCHVGKIVSSELVWEQDLWNKYNETQCPFGEGCLEGNFEIVTSHSPNITYLTVGECVSADACREVQCESMLTYIPPLPPGVQYTFQSCRVDCCDGRSCRGEGRASGGPFFVPTKPDLNAASASFENLPFLPGCNYQEAVMDQVDCLSILLNDFPYEDVENCRTNIEFTKKCLERLANRCVVGDKSTLYNAMGIPNAANYYTAFESSIVSAFGSDQMTNYFCLRNVTWVASSNMIGQQLSSLLTSFQLMSRQISCNRTMLREFVGYITSINDIVATAEDNVQFCRKIDTLLDKFTNAYKRFCDFSELEAAKLTMVASYSIKLQQAWTVLLDKLRIPKCNAVAEMEDEASNTGVYDGGWFASPDENGCERYSLDAMILIDGSKAMGASRFMAAVSLAKGLASYFDLQSHHIGLIQYSRFQKGRKLQEQKFIKTEIPLGKFEVDLRFNKAADQMIHQNKKGAFTAHAIDHAVTELKKSQRFDNRCIKKVVVVITGGSATDGQMLSTSANAAQHDGVDLVSVGIENYRRNQLIKIANENRDKVIEIPSSDQAADHLHLIGRSLNSFLTDGTDRGFVSGG